SRLMESNLVQLLIVFIFFRKGINLMAMAGKGSYLLIIGMVATLGLTVILILAFKNPHLLGSLALKLDKSRFGRFIAKVSKDDAWAEKFCVWTEDLGKGFKLLWVNNTGAILADMGLYIVDQLIYALALYAPLVSFVGPNVPIPEFLLTFILCSIVSVFIPTPGAAGSVEASFVLVLGALTGKPAETMSAILIWRLGTFYLHILFGSVIYFTVPIKSNVYIQGSDGIFRRQHKNRMKPGTALDAATTQGQNSGTKP
ncbi:MAG: YbhN family protein, partial [Spirochaetaceae bacterium]|nr:YbhN family protein [Spirochaetaceae bacterium]